MQSACRREVHRQYKADCKIDRGAFADAGIESIELPEGLKIIGNGAFSGTRLKSIVIPHNVTYIGDKAFAKCRSLSGSVEIPDDAEIGAECFRECTGICEVILPKGCDCIKQGTFCSCESLESVKNIEDVSVIGDDAFYMCMKLKTLDLSNVKSIGECAFLNAGLTEVVLKSLTSDGLGKCAFAGCVDIKEADLSESGLKHLSDGVFGGTKARVILPDYIEWFGRDCLSLTHINEVKIAGSVRIDEHAFNRADICHLISIIISVHKYQKRLLQTRKSRSWIFRTACMSSTNPYGTKLSKELLLG